MDIFDIIGPVMTGPSSSHTAGAVRLGRLAASILGTEVSEAVMGLHGSFACTGEGHGTDRALVSGLMGWTDDDPRIAQPFEAAEAAGIRYSFENVDLGELAHPNSVRFSLLGRKGESCTITGSSVGGGRVLITAIDDIRLEITGEMPTLFVLHGDRPGVIAGVTRILAERQINVARMSMFRKKKGDLAAMVVETDQPVTGGDLERIGWLENIIKVRNVRR
ncbi:L-serine ammonia-lyase, iron-sulfur-dependent subunit beta [Methanocella sp. MCL-LM]|uniref:L-serine ammonia-lyase, iron-sulfur-dependent subunit beta n=1 Tax=Methanocella sp. MCL-LM TaxID=3412035 RepID=UPI003C76CA9E